MPLRPYVKDMTTSLFDVNDHADSANFGWVTDLGEWKLWIKISFMMFDSQAKGFYWLRNKQKKKIDEWWLNFQVTSSQ